MAPKRKKSHVDGKVESQDGSAANPGDMSTFDFAKPVYLVAEHEGEKTAYSVFKVDAAAGGGGGTKPLRVHTVAGLPNTTRGMSFVTAHSKLGSWIVGVGANRERAPSSWTRSRWRHTRARGSCTPEATPSSSPSPARCTCSRAGHRWCLTSISSRGSILSASKRRSLSVAEWAVPSGVNCRATLLPLVYP
ncbi:hypothetical protein HU200_031710 [Digitaria exilis]|uniref:Uncharacterized protein n=1 Tax=Digitaria exilis TaxID=1010633 RepID=A0A835BYH9_9POAL|nr:hypothetical protein HU200_031710 [Digitaria exilis]